MLAQLFVAIVVIITAWPNLVLSQPPTKEQSSCGVPEFSTDGWQIETPAIAGIDPQSLCALIDKLENPLNANVHSVIVVRGGRLVFEHYRVGSDQRWGKLLGPVVHGPNVKHDVRSVSKSVVSLLVGIALDRKLIANIDEPVFKFFPEYASLRTPAKDRILLRHLLAMSSGIVWDENRPYSDPENSERRMISASHPYRYVLEQPLATEPGKTWNYSGGSTELLGAVVQKVTGKLLADFAREALFDPLGITDFDWVRMPNGAIAAASGLRLRSRDMAKLGQLVLSRGNWKGKQIVSTKWVEESMKQRFEVESWHYGYHWWIGSSRVGARTIDWFEAFGLGGAS